MKPAVQLAAIFDEVATEVARCFAVRILAAATRKIPVRLPCAEDISQPHRAAEKTNVSVRAAGKLKRKPMSA